MCILGDSKKKGFNNIYSDLGSSPAQSTHLCQSAPYQVERMPTAPLCAIIATTNWLPV